MLSRVVDGSKTLIVRWSLLQSLRNLESISWSLQFASMARTLTLKLYPSPCTRMLLALLARLSTMPSTLLMLSTVLILVAIKPKPHSVRRLRPVLVQQERSQPYRIWLAWGVILDPRRPSADCPARGTCHSDKVCRCHHTELPHYRTIVCSDSWN